MLTFKILQKLFLNKTRLLDSLTARRFGSLPLRRGVNGFCFSV
jgi:hypothetical protein